MRFRWILLLGVGAVLLGGGCTEQARGPMAWPEVERTHEPWTRWWWMGNAVRPDTLSHLLAEYDEAGIGGVEITPIYGVKGEEDLFFDYLSPEWMEMLHHTVQEAHNRNMGVDLATGTGWPFGGPTIAPQEAARRVVVRTHDLAEGERLSEPLRYRDERMDAWAPLQSLMAYSESGSIRDLTERVDSDGQLDWEPPAGDWTLYAVYNGWSGKRVERAAPGGEGYAINHFSEDALQAHLSRFDQAFNEHRGPDVRAFFNDSYELPRADWTARFFEAFEHRQGYDLRHHLPAFVGKGSAEKEARVRTDYRETLSSLLLDEFTRPWTEWAHDQDALTRNQAHGSPASLLDVYAAADIPETETFHASGFDIPGLRADSALQNMGDDVSPPDPLLFKFASSAGHVAGRDLISSETATWLGEHFRVSLSQVKPEVDQLFAAGINHVIFHGTPYSPPSAEWPGWLFYASTHFAPSNPFWRDLPGLTSYIARCQSFLQAGQPDNDVLLYVPMHDHWQQDDDPAFQLTVHNPEEWFYGRPVHDAAQTMHDRGYTFDYVSDRLLDDLETRNGRLEAKGGRYDVVVVPDARLMPVDTFERLLSLAEAGATVAVLGALPRDVPGWGALGERRDSLKALRGRLSFSSTSVDGVESASVGAGRVLRGENLPRLLGQTQVQREPMADHGLSFARRQHDQGRHYFLTNLGAEPVEGWVPLGTDAATAVLFDPMQERTGVASTRQTEEGTSVFLSMQPGESRILRTFTRRQVEGPEWVELEEGPPDTLEGRWSVTFVEGGPVQPDSFSTRKLASWTELGGEDAKRFAGTARYQLSFDAPSTDADGWTLDLGRVRESARVFLNGEDLGRVWAHPFRLRLDDALRSGENRLTIEVTNLMANRIADLDRRGVSWKRFYDINFVGIDYQPFDASDWAPMPSGLLGPVTLIPGTELDPDAR